MPKCSIRELASSLLAAAALSAPGAQGATALPQSFRDPVAAQWRAAIADSKVEEVQRLLAQASTNDCLEVDEQGRTALHYAVRKCTAETPDPKPFAILKLLAERGPCVNAADRLGHKPIIELEPLSWTSRARMDALKVLIACGADINAVDENGATLLHQLFHAWDDGAMHWPEVVEILLKAGLNPNAVNSAGQTALHNFFGPLGFCANREGVRETKVEVAQKVFTMLIHAGADLSIRDKEGTTPIGAMLAQYEPFFGAKETILAFTSPDLAKSLNIKSARLKNRPVLIAVCDNAKADVDLVERLLDLQADAKLTEDDGFTALHGSAWFYNYDVTKLLLDRGADVNALDDKGRTPLHELVRSTYHLSAFFGSDRSADILKTTEVLLGHGANRRLKDKDGKTAFDLLKGFDISEAEDQAFLRALKKKLKP